MVGGDSEEVGGEENRLLATVKARLGWKGLKAEEYVDEGYIFLSTPNIKFNSDIDFDRVNFITKERYLESPEIMLREGDILLAKDGSTLGITNIVKELPAPATVNSSIAVIRIREQGEVLPEFLFRWMSAEYMQNKITMMKDGQGVPHLFQADIKKFRVLIPPFDEQKRICAYLQKTIATIDLCVDKIKNSIQNQKEYREALITAAVTGQIDVTSTFRDPQGPSVTDRVSEVLEDTHNDEPSSTSGSKSPEQ